MQTENRRTCSYAEMQPIFATIRLQNNKKNVKNQLGEARKQVAEGATLKLVLEIQEVFSSVERLLSQKYDGKTVWLYVFPNVISLRSLLR